MSADETAWLIEFNGHAPTYYGKTEDGLGQTTDHNAAVRFARKEDAQAVIDDIGWTEARPIEHWWSGRYLVMPRPEQPFRTTEKTNG